MAHHSKMVRQISHTTGVAKKETLLMVLPSNTPAVAIIKNSNAPFGAAWHAFCALSCVGQLILMNTATAALEENKTAQTRSTSASFGAL